VAFFVLETPQYKYLKYTLFCQFKKMSNFTENLKEMKQEKTFRECRLSWLERTFELDQVDSFPVLENWLSEKTEKTPSEKIYLLHLQNLLDFNFRDWNEVELNSFFIGPIMSLVNFSNKKSNLFSDRIVEGTFEDWRLYGKPDSFLASGRREPKIPLFAFQEYKKMTDPDGDPAGQALAAMLAGQALNDNGLPIYGCHVIGSDWYFMALQGKEYAMSRDYSALTNEIFDIFRVLKVLKTIVAERVK
jgi:hypothetical protein